MTMKCYCNNCKRHTNHEVLSEAENSYSDEDYDYYSQQTFRLVRCLGCDNVSFNLEQTGSEYIRYNRYNEEEVYSEFVSYPEQEGTIHPIESWDIPAVISVIYKESLTAFNNRCYLLATLGLRSTVEAICLEKGLDGTLKAKIDGLKDAGIITERDHTRLEEMRLSGNNSAHQQVALEKDELLLLIDIINNILNNLYVLDKKFKDTFCYRFKSIYDFVSLLEQGMKHYSIGSRYPLRAYLPEEYKYRKEDIERFETELTKMIDEGNYTKLSKEGEPEEGKRQLFKLQNE